MHVQLSMPVDQGLHDWGAAHGDRHVQGCVAPRGEQVEVGQIAADNGQADLACDLEVGAPACNTHMNILVNHPPTMTDRGADL